MKKMGLLISGTLMTFLLISIPFSVSASTEGETLVVYDMPAVVKYRVNFTSGAHGRLSGDTLLYVKENSSMNGEEIPRVVPDSGYVFDKWENMTNVPPSVVKSWSSEFITKPTEFRAEFKRKVEERSLNTYRLYNPNTGEHFYTQSVYERDNLIRVGWKNEGIGWKAPTSGKPIYRLYNPNAKGGDHYYTMSSYEANSLVKAGWKKDNNGKPVFYSGGTVKVYVAYNPNAQSGAHNYTISKFEQDSLLKNGWKYGKVAWYAL